MTHLLILSYLVRPETYEFVLMDVGTFACIYNKI